jgi:hypothetical protein
VEAGGGLLTTLLEEVEGAASPSSAAYLAQAIAASSEAAEPVAEPLTTKSVAAPISSSAPTLSPFQPARAHDAVALPSAYRVLLFLAIALLAIWVVVKMESRPHSRAH